MTIAEVKKRQPKWFCKENIRFFGDKFYSVEQGERTGDFYLVRGTEAWTDMFDQQPKNHYRVNLLNQETAEIESLVDDIFETEIALSLWLMEN